MLLIQINSELSSNAIGIHAAGEKKSEKRSALLGFYAVDPIAHFMLVLYVNMYSISKKAKKQQCLLTHVRIVCQIGGATLKTADKSRTLSFDGTQLHDPRVTMLIMQSYNPIPLSLLHFFFTGDDPIPLISSTDRTIDRK